ncbi:MAG: hypothetical protein H0U39_08725, partial [Segetibacter sp.]|nr:hypothetical protein [Segetibacter sp.]
MLQATYGQSPDLRFKHLSDKDGLSHNILTSILQDREGFLWFGTQYGLNKYDGYNFKVFKYDPTNPNHTMRGAGPRAIQEDQEGNLWVATGGGGGLNKINKTTGEVTSYDIDKERSGSLTSIYRDREGILWIGTGKGLIKFNPKTKEFIGYTTNSPTLAVAEDSSGRIWAFGRRIYYLDRSTGKQLLFSHPFINVLINSAHLDDDGVLWLGTRSKGLFKLETKSSSFTLTPYNPNGQIKKNINARGIYQDGNDIIWLATMEGLQRINKRTDEVTTYRSDTNDLRSLSSNNIQCVYRDREGNLWVGSDNGVDKAIAYAKPFNTYQAHTTAIPVRLPENKVITVVEDSKRIIWFGNGTTGLYQFNTQNLKTTHIEVNKNDSGSLSSEGVRTIYEDKNGNIWVSTKEALHKFNRLKRKFTRYRTQFPVFAIDEDNVGNLWVACRSDPGRGAIACLNLNTGRFKYYFTSDTDTGLNDPALYAILASRTGDIWIGTGGGGLNRLNPKTGKFTYYKPNYPFTAGNLNDITVFSIFEDFRGIIWVGTNKGGLNRFDPQTKSFTYFTERDGLPSNVVVSIIADKKGNLWLGTYGGISRFNPGNNIFRNYDASDGLPDNAFYIGSIYRRNENLLFGSPSGFVRFDPDSLEDNPIPPQVYITALKVLQTDQPLPTGKLELSYNQNFLSFDFVALNYNSPDKNRYAYKMEGLDKGWIYSDIRRYASYTNIPPGKYNFRVKASNNDGVWNEKGASIPIIIHAPWWRTTWAYALYSISFLIILWLINNNQKVRFIQREREHTREIELVHAKEIEKAYHELKVTQKQLIQREKMASLGELTAGIAHEIQNPLNFVNNFSEVSTELIEEMKEEILARHDKAVTAIADDLKQNLEKINHHGKKADNIVKGML